MILTAVQAVYLAAFANSNEASTPDVVALAQPSPVQTGACKNALQEETRFIEAQNQFVPGVAIYASSIGGDEANRLAKDGVFIGGNSVRDYIDLQGGNILISPDKDLTIATRSGNIHVGAGAVAFVIDSGEDTVVYDLLQTKPKQVVVTANKHSLAMEPGRMFVLTGQPIKDFEQLPVDCHRVSYRNVQPLNANSPSQTVKVFAADFSVASAMVTVEPLKRLTVSRNREDKIAVERMLKGAVLLGDFSTSPQPMAANYPVTAAESDPTPLHIISDSDSDNN